MKRRSDPRLHFPIVAGGLIWLDLPGEYHAVAAVRALDVRFVWLEPPDDVEVVRVWCWVRPLK